MLSTPLGKQSVDESQLDRIFRALGDRTRRKLLQRLAGGPSTISELARPFDMSLPAVSKHLRVLERAGLVRRRVRGRAHHCWLTAAPMADAESWMSYYRRFWGETLNGLSDHLRGHPD